MYTLDFRRPHKKKSGAVKSGDRAGQLNSSRDAIFNILENSETKGPGKFFLGCAGHNIHR